MPYRIQYLISKNLGRPCAEEHIQHARSIEWLMNESGKEILVKHNQLLNQLPSAQKSRVVSPLPLL